MKNKISYRNLIMLVSSENLALCLAILKGLGLRPKRKIRNASGVWLTAKASMEQAKPLMLRLWDIHHPQTGRRIFPTVKTQTYLKGQEARDFNKTLKVFSLGAEEKIPLKDRLWVDPRGFSAKGKRNTLYLNYGGAFGAGNHPTTRMSAEMLHERMSHFRRPNVLDLGCGTGILSMAAKKWGAKSVWAVDHDPTALEIAAGNFKRNRITGVVLRERMEECRLKFQIVIVNINVKAVIFLKEVVLKRLDPKGFLILGGLEHQYIEHVLRAYSDFHLVERRNDQRWVNLLMTPI